MTPGVSVMASTPRILTIVNRRGLHARAAAKFVKTVAPFSARVTVTREGTTASGDSIMGLMMLAAVRGATIEVRAEGPEADAALAVIEALVCSGFEEDLGEET